MIDVFISLAIITGLGSILRFIFPDIDIENFRRSINRLVLYIVLPALIFNIITQADPGAEFYQVPIAAIVGISMSLLLAILIFSKTSLPSEVKGSFIIASAFSNVTYLGLPVLQGIFVDQAERISVVAILYEVSTSPFLLTIGAAIAVYYGRKGTYSLKTMLSNVLRLPPLWALGIALLFNIFEIPVPVFLKHATKTISVIASGLMILSLGMALRYEKLRHIKGLAVVVVIQLFIIPIIVFYVAKLLNIQQPFYSAVVIEAAMPTQLLTLVIADEFNLDIHSLASAILVTTIASLLTIPLIQYFMLS